MRRITKVGGMAAAAVALAITTANAAVTFNSETGMGFVGKGDVQLALGYNNSQLQKNANNLTFTSSQAASQAFSQDASQAATQAGTQGVTRTVSCVIENKKRTFVNDGSREGVREGSRSGSRTGSRAGTVSGNISYTVAYDPRVRNQITGFTLKGFQSTPAFVPSGPAVWDEPAFGDWAFGDWTMGEIEWGGWQAEPGENPADCLGGNPGVSELSDETVPGGVEAGDITEGDIAYGAETGGAVTPTGAAQLFVNGKAL